MIGRKEPRLSAIEAEEILQEIFQENYVDSNSIPVEQLELYSNYRSEKRSIQKTIAIAMFVCFFLLPLWFVAPRFVVTQEESGFRDLPVYAINVSNYLPIYSVSAVQNGYSIPVYQRQKKVFTIEPIHNGEINITVKLFSKQWFSKTISVDSIDDKGPELVKSEVVDGHLYLYFSDENSVDIQESYVEYLAENIKEAVAYNEELKCVEISDFANDGVLHIFDTKGNENAINIINKNKTL